MLGNDDRSLSRDPIATQDATPNQWDNPNRELKAFYKDLLKLRHSSPALLRGSLVRVPYDCETILVFMREHSDEQMLCMINFSDFQPEIPLPDSLVCVQWQVWRDGEFQRDPVNLHNREIGVREVLVARRVSH
ncbi:DUF3459 domain-containing protein [bacterium]|nr:DUF3459 domain-containing protein [bacterium]